VQGAEDGQAETETKHAVKVAVIIFLGILYQHVQSQHFAVNRPDYADILPTVMQ
jgi:hypothetical protein